MLDLEDVLSARLTQLDGVLTALKLSIDDDGSGGPSYAVLKNALWAATELLDQAERARKALYEIGDKSR